MVILRIDRELNLRPFRSLTYSQLNGYHRCKCAKAFELTGLKLPVIQLHLSNKPAIIAIATIQAGRQSGEPPNWTAWITISDTPKPT